MSAYVIAEARLLDDPGMSRYRELAAASIAQYGGRYLARGGIPSALEGDWPPANRMVIIEFDNLEQAERWYSSPEYAHARTVHPDIRGRRMLLVEGIGELS